MKYCDCCGKVSSKMLTIEDSGESYTFDSFICAAYFLAPTCDHCGDWILGRPVMLCGQRFCDLECAQLTEPGMLASH